MGSVARNVTNQTWNVTTTDLYPRKLGLSLARNVTTLLAVVTIVAGCQTSGGTYCDIARPIRLTSATVAALTDAEVKSILAHNRKGAELCHWRP